MARRSPFAIQYRTRSGRTESGWTKWKHYIVAESREDADRIIASLERDWCHEYAGEVRVVSNTGTEQK